MAGPYALDDIRHYLGLVKETVPGTGQAPTLFVPFTGDVALDHSPDATDVYEGGTGPYTARSVKTTHKPNGTFTLPIKPAAFAKLVAWFLGADASVAAGALFDHTASPAQAPVYTSVEWGSAGADLFERIAGSVLHKLTITSPEDNGELTAAFTFAGRTIAVVTTASPTYETGMHAATPGAAYRPSDCTYTFDNVAATNVASWELTADWGIDDAIFTSSPFRAAFVKQKLTLELKVKILELTTDRYRAVNYGSVGATAPVVDFLDGTTTSWQAAYTNGLTSTNLRNLTIAMPNVAWKTASRKLTADGGTSFIEVNGTPRKPAGDIITVISRTADTAAYV
jgi:hypothetical protein